VVDLDGDSGSADIALDATTTGRVDLLVEVFTRGPPAKLVASGVMAAIDLLPPRQRPLRLALVRPGRFCCTPGPQDAPRAFHSATELPNGQVLLVGGLTMLGQAASTSGLRVDHGAEVYEPRTGTFTKVAGDLPEGRAFHSALLLSSPLAGPYDLLLVGGVAAHSKQPTEAVVKVGGSTDPLPFVPTANAVPAESVVIRYYPWADPPQVQQLEASPALGGRIFHALATAPGGELLALGGVKAMDSGGRVSTVDDLDLLTASRETDHTGPFSLQRARVGAAVASLGSSGGVLVYGGNLDSAAGKEGAEAAEVVTVSSTAGTASSKLGTIEFGSQSRTRAVSFATLTPLSGGDLLLVGGVEVDQGRATQLRAKGAVQRLNLVSGSLRVSDVTASSSFTPVAFHEALTLPGGEVMISGGMAAPGTCPPGRGCDRVYSYDASGDKLSLVGSMLTARTGHRATPMAGDQVLLSGGLQLDGTKVKVLRAAELYSTAGQLVDPYGRSVGKASSTPCGGAEE
jgi:hypothetical protein